VDDLTQRRVDDALAHVGSEWSAERTAAAWRGLTRKRTRRARRRVAAAASLTLLVVASGTYLMTGSTLSSTPKSTSPGGSLATNPAAGPASLAARSPEQFADAGSAAQLPIRPREPVGPIAIQLGEGLIAMREPGAQIEVVRSNDAGTITAKVSVVRGKTRFTRTAPATPEKSPTTAISAGALSVTVYSTDFTLARYRDVVDVWSASGATEVVWQGETIVIAEGEHRRFSESDSGAEAENEGGEQGAQPVQDLQERRRAASPDWRPYARDGDLEKAYKLLRRQGPGRRVADLMLAADVFRMSGHPKYAVAPLSRVVDKEGDDPRAPLAAFTLGRVLLDDLGRAASAARAFARARAIAPDGPMAEDALAREVEALAKAGQERRARQRADLYIERYPHGRRVRAVKQFAGL